MRRATTILRVFLASAVALSTARAGAEPAPDKASAEKPNFAELLKGIKSAKEPAEAIALFAKARAIDAKSVPLHRLYMTRMLELGYPRIASYPAATLTVLDPKDATAWGIIGYQHAKTGKFSTAFDPAIRAVALGGDNKPILHNAGALLGWQEATKIPAGSPATRTLITKHRDRWMKHHAFSASYDRLRDAFKKRAAELSKLQANIDAREKDIEKMSDDARQLDAKARRNNAQAASLNDDSRKLAPEIKMIGIRIDRGSASYSMRRRRHRLQSQVDKNNRRVKDLARDNDKLARKLQELRAKYAKAKDTLDESRTALNKAQRESPTTVTWSLPTVDGRTFTDIEADGKIVPFGAATDTKPQRDSATNAEKAQSLLNLAKMLLRNNRPDSASETLKTLIRRYARTPAAAEAKQLLKTLPNP